MATDIDPILNDLIARVGRVRRWLLALGVLKIAALWLGCLSVYVGLYALIDHHVHFQWPGRLVALLLLVVLLAVLCRYLAMTLRRDMTYSHAANHVENKQSFDQQLVAVVEFYEGKADYPYSKSLARQLVVQVDRATEGFALDSTITKWHGYLLAGCVALCLSVVTLFIGQNVHYFTSYLMRLVRPFSQVEPMPKTVLESITGDTVTGPNTPVTLSAALSGELPDSAELVLTRPPIEEPNGLSAPRVERIPVEPRPDGKGQFTLTAEPSFDSLEDVTYRFEAGGRSTESHSITVAEPPTIERITATITRPSPDGIGPDQTYTEEVTNGLLEVLPDSHVQLQVQTNTPLQKATATGPDGEPMTQTSQSSDSFGVEFSPEEDSAVEFSFVSDKGLSNDGPQKLQVRLTTDKRPEFELLSPDGDYLATDVASIPIEFKITDDFGLDSARLFCERPNGPSMVLDACGPSGAREATLSCTLELEQYDLSVGDSLLFYAEATDVDTGQGRVDANSASEIYFIEIRSYQQFWHPMPGGPPSSQPGMMAEDLITILEYLRAIVKRTWAIAQEPTLTAGGLDKLDAIGQDLERCAVQTGTIRDDPNSGFTEAAKAELSGIIEQYKLAQGHLAGHDARAALGPEREAYRRLRKFIDELHMMWSPPSPSPSVPQDTPERVKLQEQPEGPEQENDRPENQLQEIQQELEKLSQEQELLKKDLADALEDQASKAAQSSASETPSQGSRGQEQQGDSSGQSSQGSSGQGRSSGEPSESDAASGSSGAQEQSSSSSQGSDAASQGSSGQGQQGNSSQGSDAASQGSGSQGQSAGESSESDAASQGTGSQGQASGQSQASDTASQGSGGQGQSASQSQASDMASQGSSGQGQSSGQSSQSDTASQGKGGQGQSSGQSQSSDAASQGSSGQGQSSGQSRASDTASQGSGGHGQGSKGPASQSSEGGAGSNWAEAEARLRMLEAKQRALNEQASRIASKLGQLPASEASGQTAVQDEAQQSVERAIESMEQVEEKLAEARYNPAPSKGREFDMSRLADSAIRQLNQASQGLKKGLATGNQDSAADQAQAMAEQLAKDAEALDRSVDAAEQTEMLKRLEEAERLLRSMAGTRQATIMRGGGPGASHVFTNGQATAPGEAARLLSRQFWSIAVQARDRQVGPVQDEPSDIEFFDLENEFFENAARFRPERKEK